MPTDDVLDILPVKWQFRDNKKQLRSQPCSVVINNLRLLISYRPVGASQIIFQLLNRKWKMLPSEWGRRLHRVSKRLVSPSYQQDQMWRTDLRFVWDPSHLLEFCSHDHISSWYHRREKHHNITSKIYCLDAVGYTVPSFTIRYRV